MQQNDINELAKEFCHSFLLERLTEDNKAIERLAACQCGYLGGKRCECTPSDYTTTKTQMENGVISNGDEKDSSANRKAMDGVIFDTTSDSASKVASQMKSKRPIIRQPSMDQVYDGLRDPYVIMINIVNFKKKPSPRNGAETDTKNLKKFLQRANFNTLECHFDVKKKEMMKIFQDAQKNTNLLKHDGLMCFIMSHGSSKGIETADNKYIKVDEITALFRGNDCPHFATKPKLFFIQACRGEEEDDGYIVPRGPTDVETDSEEEEELPVKMPSDADFLIAFSTTKGNCAYRRFLTGNDYEPRENQLMGSWFIASLVDVFLAYAHEEDLLSMLTRVNNAMAELYTDRRQKQISCHLSMLTKKIHFLNMEK